VKKGETEQLQELLDRLDPGRIEKRRKMHAEAEKRQEVELEAALTPVYERPPSPEELRRSWEGSLRCGRSYFFGYALAAMGIVAIALGLGSNTRRCLLIVAAGVVAGLLPWLVDRMKAKQPFLIRAVDWAEPPSTSGELFGVASGATFLFVFVDLFVRNLLGLDKERVFYLFVFELLGGMLISFAVLTYAQHRLLARDFERNAHKSRVAWYLRNQRQSTEPSRT
jgi:hypothetical protein